jgi:GNAT superfamily N-acetyltransferase
VNPKISVEQEDPRGEAATQLIRELSAEIVRRYGDLGHDGSGSFSPNDALVPRSAFVVARLDGAPAGCGAIRPLEAEAVEIKRMYVAPMTRRLGVGLRILAELERLAEGFGYRFLRLETGVRQPEAIALYERFGFHRIPAFGKYVGDPISLCYEKSVGSFAMNWVPRLATEADIPRLEQLIPLSVRALQAAHYSLAQMEAALGPVFGVDRQLIRDGTYFVVEHDGELIGCGGWSRRRSLFGGDHGRVQPDPELDPKHDPARVRAFFVHPAWARRGIGRSLLMACEQAIREAHFRNIDLVATLAGEPLYAAFGYTAVERFEIPLAGGLSLPAVRMTKCLQIAAV